MSNIIMIVTIIGSLTTTAYRSVPQQTDDSPYFTSTGEHVAPGGVAVSRDLLCGACRKLHRRCQHPEYAKKLHYGDWLYSKEVGFVKINDVMGAFSKQRIKNRIVRIPINNHIDVWVPRLVDEKAFYKKHGSQPVEWWKVEAKEKL